MTAGIDRRPFIRDRRLARTRRTVELTLDRIFRPRNWAATISYSAGLQGRMRVETTTLSVPVLAGEPLSVTVSLNS